MAVTPSPGCTNFDPLDTLFEADSVDNITIVVDNEIREFILYTPPALNDTGKLLPLVLNFHGTPSTAYLQYIYTELDTTAYENDFFVAYPNGVDEAFNAGGCCAETHDLNDVNFAREIVKYISEEACIDLDQVFATGWSNGGYMAYYLACQASDVFAAIAPVGGSIGVDPLVDCKPSRPIPVLHFHEVRDPDVNYCGSYPEYITVPDLVAVFAEKQGCSPDQMGISYQQGEVTCRSHKNCPAGMNATLCTIDRNFSSHSWPQAESDLALERGTQDILGNDEIWKFFAATAAATTPSNQDALLLPDDGVEPTYCPTPATGSPTASDTSSATEEGTTAATSSPTAVGAPTASPIRGTASPDAGATSNTTTDHEDNVNATTVPAGANFTDETTTSTTRAMPNETSSSTTTSEGRGNGRLSWITGIFTTFIVLLLS